MERSLDNGPVPITVNSWTIVEKGEAIFPPIEHLNVLSDAVKPSISNLLLHKIFKLGMEDDSSLVIAWPKGYDKKQLDNAVEGIKSLNLISEQTRT